MINSLEESCKLLFEEHLKENGVLSWTKQTYQGFDPNILQAACELLIQTGLLYRKDNRTTAVSPRLIYAEVMNML